MRDCKRLVDYVKAAQRKLAYWSKKRAGRPTAAAVLFATMEQMNPPAVDEGTGAKEETVADVEELYYETLLMGNGGTDAEGDTESGFEEGPTRSVVGRNQARAYTRLTGTLTLANKTTPAKFMFGGTITPSLGIINMRVPIASTLYANLLIDVVDVDVPLLTGLDAFDALGLYINNVDNMLKCDKRGIATPL
eukprot:contig_27730_g6826